MSFFHQPLFWKYLLGIFLFSQVYSQNFVLFFFKNIFYLLWYFSWSFSFFSNTFVLIFYRLIERLINLIYRLFSKFRWVSSKFSILDLYSYYVFSIFSIYFEILWPTKHFTGELYDFSFLFAFYKSITTIFSSHLFNFDI